MKALALTFILLLTTGCVVSRYPLKKTTTQKMSTQETRRIIENKVKEADQAAGDIVFKPASPPAEEKK